MCNRFARGPVPAGLGCDEAARLTNLRLGIMRASREPNAIDRREIRPIVTHICYACFTDPGAFDDLVECFGFVPGPLYHKVLINLE